MDAGHGGRHRVETVDFARGIAAAGVMSYHLLYYEQVADLVRISYYFVYAFFVISGFALYIRYRDDLRSIEDLRRYAVSRFRRIAPLFWFAIALYLVLVDFPDDPWVSLPLNISLAFGFANPGTSSLLLGGWSIGIEMVFYAVTPVVIIFCRGSLARVAAVALASTILMILFINHQLADADAMTTDLWAAYSQPMSFFGYFAAGCFIGEVYLQKHKILKGHLAAAALLALALAVFFAVPVESAPQMLRSWSGIALMLATVSAVAAIAFLPEPTGASLKAAWWFGQLSYSIYLFHPIVYVGLAQPNFSGSSARIMFSVFMTIALAVAAHYLIEKRFRSRSVPPPAGAAAA